jgi:hypothetical protein
MDLGTGPVKDFHTQITHELHHLREDPRFPTVTPDTEGMQNDKISNHYYPNALPEYILPHEHRPQHYKPDLIRAIGYKYDAQGILEEDTSYTGRRSIQLIECKYATDTNMQIVIDQIYDLYDPLKQAIMTHATGAWKVDVHIIPIVISRTGSFHVKTLAEIAQLVSFKEEPPDTLTYRQLTRNAQEIAMALHVHAQEWLTLLSKLSRRLLTTPSNTPH